MTRPKFLPAWFPALVAAALCAHALPAWGASVKQVRVGDHADHTRIVIELDGPAGYSVEQKAVAGVAELVVGLEATTSTRVIGSRSRLVESVRLRPGPRGAEARIALRAGAVNVKEMVLKSPHRIVLDISPAKAPAVTRAPTPTATPTPAPTRTAAAPKPAPTATRVEAAPTPELAPGVKPSVQAGTRPVPQTSPAPTRPDAQAGPDAPAARSRALASGETVAAGDAEASAAGKARAAAAEARAAAARSEQAEPRAAAARKKPPEPAAAAEPSLVERLGAGDPGLGLTIALGGVAFLVAAFLLLRRRSQRIAREAAAAPWPPPGAEERPEAAFHRAAADEEDDPEREPLAPMDETDAPLFAATERDEEGDEPVVELPEASFGAEPGVTSGAEPAVVASTASPEVEELERRIERLEARLADSLDARERLERQLAAHTEELRVQRAAIARTQRAVRAAVRNPDAPELPAAQRVPSQMPGPASGPKPGEDEG